MYVLGASVEGGLDEVEQGKTIVKPCPYDVILNSAHASRRFNLQKRIEESRPEIKQDEEISEVLEGTLDFENNSAPKVQ